MVHGRDALMKVKSSTAAVFSSEIIDLTNLSESEFLEHFKDQQRSYVPSKSLESNLNFSGLMALVGARKTRADARRVI